MTAGAVAAAALAFTVLPGGALKAPSADAKAVETLLQAGMAAAAAPDVELRDGQRYYVGMRETGQTIVMAPVPEIDEQAFSDGTEEVIGRYLTTDVTEYWSTADGPRLQARREVEKPSFPTEADRRALEKGFPHDPDEGVNGSAGLQLPRRPHAQLPARAAHRPGQAAQADPRGGARPRLPPQQEHVGQGRGPARPAAGAARSARSALPGGG